MRDAIDAMRDAFRQLADGRAALPQRTAVPVPQEDAVMLVMPARCEVPFGLGGKFVSVFPKNADRGRPLIHAAVLLISPDTGEPRALIEGTSLTAIRTGAASGLATELLAHPHARRVAIIGAGVQARTQLEAVCCVREVEDVVVFSRTRERAQRFAREMAGKSHIPNRILVADAAAAAAQDAEVVCVATTSPTPVLVAADVPPGAHINAVGSYRPEMIELDPTLVAQCRVVVDQREAAMAEAGEVIAAIRDGLMTGETVVQLGEILVGSVPGRRDQDEVTLFKSVGIATQDLCAASRAVSGAAAMGLGVAVEW